MGLMPHTEAWYAWLAQQQEGYFYPGGWRVAPHHGEDTFRAMVLEHITPETDVLEVACAQGELSLVMAARARTVLGYDATAEYIDLARKAAAERRITNAQFVVHNARAQYHGGVVRLPAEEDSIDLWVNSKGPFHTILDARRVCRPGAVLLMLVPTGGVPGGGLTPAWNDLLPEPFRQSDPEDYNPNWAYRSITQHLNEAGLRLHSWWDFDVPVLYPNPKEWYIRLAWGYAREIPTYEEVEAGLARIFREFAGADGLEDRWRRSIWKAVV